MRTLFVAAIFLGSLFLQAQVKPELFGLEDIAYPILSIKKSPSSSLLFMSLSGGRFLLYDMHTNPRLTSQSAPLWKNFSVNGFNYGADAEFSKDERLILVSEKYARYNRDRVRTESFPILVLDSHTGSVIYQDADVCQAQFQGDDSHLVISKENTITLVNLISKEKKEFASPLEIETACLNHKGNLLAISYDPERQEFRTKEGAGYNRNEVKNAVRNKKLITFFEFPSMKNAGTIGEEVDVVFNMKFSGNDSYLIFYSRTKQLEHQKVNILNGLDKTMDLNQFQRIDMESLKVDNLNFIYQTSEANANSDLDEQAGLFVYGDNRGLFAAKREVLVVNFNKQQEYLGKYTFQGRSGTRNIHSTAFSIVNDSTLLVANGLKLAYWNFRKLREYSEMVEPMDANDILDKAASQLDSDLDSMESSLSKSISKKKISGIYIMTLTLQKKGEVVSIYTRSDEKTNIAMQNSLKDLLLKYRFDVDIPKNERVKFTYTFNL